MNQIKSFMDKDFLLSNPISKHLFHDFAAPLPIVDYHCHIPPSEIAKNRGFANITEAWLAADHYKWRAMRACGVSEKFITGDADDFEKFKAYACCMPLLIGNPLYHWSHLELSRYCDIDKPLSPDSAEEIWENANKALNTFSARDVMIKSNVHTICTTDDPADSLEFHDIIAADREFSPHVLPAFRPDRVLHIEKPDFPEYIKTLEKSTEISIQSFNDLISALRLRIIEFNMRGCKAADHGILKLPKLSNFGHNNLNLADSAFQKRLNGGELNENEYAAFQSEIFLALAREYFKYDWVMEIHFGVLRNTNSKMMRLLGADSGFDNMAEEKSVINLTRFLDKLDSENSLPKTLLFSLNPVDNAPLCSLCGAFGDRVQQGSAWWFNDSQNGMTEQMTTYASFLPLGKFIGFLTDSRSFLSYTRHEYFRRLLCEWIGNRVMNGAFPNDEKALKTLVDGICFENAVNFFGFSS